MAEASRALRIFDFDGTLVHSAAAKRNAFFDVFPPCAAGAVEAVLTENPDGSRNVVIPEMIRRSGLTDVNPESLIADFGRRTDALVRGAPLVDGAVDALAWAAGNGNAYVFSVTPHDVLCAELERRDLMRHLSGAWGYPNSKTATLAMLISQQGILPSNAVVIGDGESDAEAARLNGAAFLRADAGWPQRLMSGAWS